MSAFSCNLYIVYLNRYTTTSTEHEVSFDEFISQTAPPSGKALRLETKTEQFVHACFQQERLPPIILTDNAGDGSCAARFTLAQQRRPLNSEKLAAVARILY